VDVVPGGIVTRDFELKSVLQPGAEEVIRLGQFTVSGEREGTAKAIMEQRNSRHHQERRRSDTSASSPRATSAKCCSTFRVPAPLHRRRAGESMMRGMAAKYGALQVDGCRMTGGGTRASELTSYSAYATDTIEYSKTNSADMDADAPRARST
jgi:hypothetical protein